MAFWVENEIVLNGHYHSVKGLLKIFLWKFTQM